MGPDLHLQYSESELCHFVEITSYRASPLYNMLESVSDVSVSVWLCCDSVAVGARVVSIARGLVAGFRVHV